MNIVSLRGLEVASKEENSSRLLGLYDMPLETIQWSLVKVFKETPAELILGQMKKSSLSLEHGGEAGFEVFSDLLRGLLGSGSPIVEKLILRALFTV